MKKNLLLLLPMAIFLFSCEVEGPIGPQGPAGQNGQDGQDGNANVISKSYTINPSDWVEHGNFGNFDHYYDLTINISEITNDIFQNGSVIVYIKDLNSDIYYTLPYIIADSLGTMTISYSYQTGKLLIEITDSTYETFPPDGVVNIKVVIIEATDN